jgi:hypothetical protein
LAISIEVDGNTKYPEVIIFLAKKGKRVTVDISKIVKNSLIFLLIRLRKAGIAASNRMGTTDSLIVTATRLKKATSSQSGAARCFKFFSRRR